MSLSVVDPISPAIARTKRMLFEPFDIGKWLRLGFCAFLMQLASGGGSGGGGQVNVPWHGGAPGGGNRPGGGEISFDPMIEWLRDYGALIAIGALIIVLIVLLLMWLSSRGQFMFLDGVVRNRGAVVAPWHEYAGEANSLFLFRVCLGVAALLAGLVILTLGGLVAWPDIQSREFGVAAVGALAISVTMFVMLGLTLAVISTLLTDIVVPVMYLRRVSVMAAWGEFFSSMLAGNKLAFLLYLLMRLLISMVVGALALGVTCLTCCIVAIPYVGSVILLPLTVFVQAYPLYFIEQFGPSWRVFPAEKPPPATNS